MFQTKVPGDKLLNVSLPSLPIDNVEIEKKEARIFMGSTHVDEGMEFRKSDNYMWDQTLRLLEQEPLPSHLEMDWELFPEISAFRRDPSEDEVKEPPPKKGKDEKCTAFGVPGLGEVCKDSKQEVDEDLPGSSALLNTQFTYTDYGSLPEDFDTIYDLPAELEMDLEWPSKGEICEMSGGNSGCGEYEYPALPKWDWEAILNEPPRKKNGALELSELLQMQDILWQNQAKQGIK